MSLFDSASLIVTPSGYKEDKLYSIKPTDGSGDLSVTRATTATRVNSDGLIEQVPYNLFNYSQEFNNVAWNNTSGVTITANSAIAPNGTLTAERFVGTGGAWYFAQQKTLTAGITHTISVYVKSNTGSNQTFRLFGSTLLISGNLTATSEWQRFEFSFTSTTSPDHGIARDSSNNNVDLLVWGAQLVSGTSAKEYFPTTDRLDVPRLDYTNSSCPSILVEPQRTNLALRSQELDSALVWFPVAATVSANNTTAPDGTVSADKLIATSATSTHIILQQPSGSVNGTTSTVSIFAKAAGLSRIQLVNNAGGLGVANYNLSTGTATLVNGVSASIQDYGNGWYRCIMTYTPTNTGNFNIQVRLADNSGNTTFLGNGVDGVSLWGAQVELGSNATSYVPTVASSVTRNADVISKTGISSLIGQTEGTIFCEINNTLRTYQEGYLIRLFADANNEVWIRKEGGTNTYSARFRANSVNVYTKLDINVLNGNNKIAFAYKSGDLAIYLNGVQIGTSTSTGAFSATVGDLNLGYTSTAFFNDRIKSAMLFKTRLSNTELAQLTTI